MQQSWRPPHSQQGWCCTPVGKNHDAPDSVMAGSLSQQGCRGKVRGNKMCWGPDRWPVRRPACTAVDMDKLFGSPGRSSGSEIAPPRRYLVISREHVRASEPLSRGCCLDVSYWVQNRPWTRPSNATTRTSTAPDRQASWVSTNSIGVSGDTDLPLQALHLFEVWGGVAQNSGPLKHPTPVNSASRGSRPRGVLDRESAPSCRQKDGGPRPEDAPTSPLHRCETEERAGPRRGASTALAPEFFCRTPRARQSDRQLCVGHQMRARDDGTGPLTGPVCGSSSRTRRFFPHVRRSRTRHVDRRAVMVGWSGPRGPAVPPGASIAHRLRGGNLPPPPLPPRWTFWGWGAREGRPLAGPATPPRRAAANLKPTRHGRACCRRPPPHGGQPWPAPSTLARLCSPSGRLAANATPGHDYFPVLL